MGNTMKAAVVRELGKPLTIEEVPVPEPEENQILVRIAATGICHTDLHAAKGDWPVKPRPPFIPGHEGVGRWPLSAVPYAASRKATASDSMAAHGLRVLLALPHWLGDVVRLPVEQRLLGERQLRGICARRSDYVGRLPDNLEWGPLLRSCAPA